MTEDQEKQAFDAIHDEAARLLNLEGEKKSLEIDGGLQLIMALARYKHDVRSVQEIKKANAAKGN